MTPKNDEKSETSAAPASAVGTKLPFDLQKGGLTRGTNQSGSRLYNERLILSLLRRHGDMPKAEIARVTGLSAQTASTIVNALESDGLVVRGAPHRGRVGQPSIPYKLDPAGAYAFGLKIGRRSLDLCLVDFAGNMIANVHERHNHPTTERVIAFTLESTKKLLANTPNARQRIAGFGIAAPFELWRWLEEMKASQQEIAAWRNTDIQQELENILPWQVFSANDITAACAAEFMFGSGDQFADFLYVYVGSFMGGGLVIDGHLFPGRQQNAGALGSMPLMPPRMTQNGRSPQLMNMASIYALEQELTRQGKDYDILWSTPQNWENLGDVLENWTRDVADTLAFAICGAVAVIDVDTVIIDGAFPSDVRSLVLTATQNALSNVDQQALSPFALHEGTIGFAARAMGAAALPFLANLSLDRDVLFKQAVVTT